MEQPAEMDRRRPSGPGDPLLFVFSRFHSFFLSAFSLFAFFCFFDVDVHGRAGTPDRERSPTAHMIRRRMMVCCPTKMWDDRLVVVKYDARRTQQQQQAASYYSITLLLTTVILGT
jgi:hypothetical protein